MISAIGPGDLVMATKACCDAFVRCPVFRVFSVESHPCEGPGVYLCRWCKRPLPDAGFATDGPDEADQILPLPWLKKIDPPAAQEETEEEEVIDGAI